MKKKSFLLVVMFVCVLSCFVFLNACGNKEKDEQTSNLNITNIYQNAYGAVLIEFENANDYIDVQVNNQTVSYEMTIEISCDNGTIWNDYSIMDIDNINLGVLLSYDYENNNFFYSLNPQTLSVGFTANILARLKETETKKASLPTAAYSYVLKAPVTSNQSMYDRFGTYVGTDLSGTINRVTETQIDDEGTKIYFDERFEFVDSNNDVMTRNYVMYRNGDTVRIGSVDVDETTFTITPYTNYNNFEYQIIYDESDAGELSTEINSYNSNPSNWHDLGSTGIVYDFEEDTVLINEIPHLRLLIRFKETNTTCASIIYYNYFEFIQ